MREIFMETILLKLTTEEKQLLEFAALLRNVTVEDFILETVRRNAEALINSNEPVVLTADEIREILDSEDRPFEPNAYMKKGIELAEQAIANSKHFRRPD